MKGPLIASWYDHTGKRRERSTRTTDRAAAERILAKHVADVALRRDGVIDPRQDRFQTEGSKPLEGHVAAYLEHCRHAEQAPRFIQQKQAQLSGLLAGTKATRLSDLTAETLEGYLAMRRDSGLSARSINFTRQIAIAFYSWCVRTARAESNPLKAVPRLDESRDRRRVRRALTDDELARLMAVARERGREAWYMTAVLAGLRKGDLQRLTWGDVDFERRTLTIRDGKSRAVDVLSMHSQLAEVLQQRLEENPALRGARVFPTTVTDRTRQKDFLRAGLAREEEVTDANGNTVMIGKGKWKRAKTRIVVEDEDGRVIDLHGMRHTMSTRLARHGVFPQVLTKIMRHGSTETTQTYYTRLELADTAAGVEAMPYIGVPEGQEEQATGTADSSPARATSGQERHPQRYSQQLGRGMARVGASDDSERWDEPDTSEGRNAIAQGDLRDPVQAGAMERAKGLEPSTFSLGS